MIKAVVFDMDGVLFDTERLSMESWKEIADKKKIPRMDHVATDCIGRNRVGICDILREAYGRDFDAENFLDETGQHAQDKVEKDGLPIMKGVTQLLEYLKERQFKIGLASSTRKARILSHLERAGLTDYFEVIIGGDMVEHGKPAPDIYQKACQLLEVNPEEAIALEDSPNGIRSASGAGMKAIMVPDCVKPTQEMEELSIKICNHLLEVKDYIRDAF